MVQVRGAATTWVARVFIVVAVLVALLVMLSLNVRLGQQARDLNQPMPCSSDNDSACRSGFVR